MFIRVLRARDGFRGESSPTTWLYRITTNHCFNLLRDAARRARRVERYLTIPGEAQAVKSPAEAHITVGELVARLPPHLFELAVYAYLDRMTQEEIAELVDLSRKTVGLRLETARLLAAFEAEYRLVGPRLDPAKVAQGCAHAELTFTKAR